MLKLPQLNTKQIDGINIGLMFISLILAYILPFEVFLFSYAVLGPLHYLTEISWLHQRNYFVPNEKKNIIWGFVILAAILTLFLTYSQMLSEVNSVLNDQTANKSSTFYNVAQRISAMKLPVLKLDTTKFIVFLFGSAAILILFKKMWLKAIFIIALLMLCLTWNMSTSCVSCDSKGNGEKVELCDYKSDAQVVNFIKAKCADKNNDGYIKPNEDFNSGMKFRTYVMFFSAYLPTLIHVYIFTMLFMLFGALKSKSNMGLISVGILVTCGVLIFVVDPSFIQYTISDYAKRSYDVSFLNLNQIIFSDFGLGEATSENIYNSRAGIKLGRFIAFAYTYHYLNWFSKTSIIQWHKMPMVNLIVVLALWGTSVGLYLADYQLGLMVLIYLSFIHVFLEFPLNWQSFVGIFNESVGKFIFKPKTA